MTCADSAVHKTKNLDALRMPLNVEANIFQIFAFIHDVQCISFSHHQEGDDYVNIATCLLQNYVGICFSGKKAL